MAVEIQKLLCGGRKTENLIESTCFVRILVESACFAMTIVPN